MMCEHTSVFRGAVFLALVAGSAAAQEVHNDVLKLDERFQTIDHFTAADAWTLQHLDHWPKDTLEHLADLLFCKDKGIGLSAWRFKIGAGINEEAISDHRRTTETFETAPGEYDFSRQRVPQWFLQAAKERGVDEFHAYVYSPPMRLTKNELTNMHGLDSATTNLKPGAEQCFAEYLADIVEHFHTHPETERRVSFDWISPYNEPQWAWESGQEGNRASNADMARFIPVLAAELDSRGLPTQVLAPESGDIPSMYELREDATQRWDADYGDYAAFFIEETGLAEALGNTLAYHSYWSDDAIIEHREALARTMEEYPDWRLFQTEYCVMEWDRDLTMDTALRVAQIIHADLTVVNAASWGWWLALSPYDYKDGLLYVEDDEQAATPEDILTPRLLWALGHYSRFVRPGAERVGLEGAEHDIEGVAGSAYHHAGDGRLTLVYFNQLEDSALLTVDLPEQAAGLEFTPYVTTDAEGQTHEAQPVVRGVENFELPARSMVTFVGEEL